MSLDSGKLEGLAVDKGGNAHKCHPVTKVAFDGFEIPFRSEVLDIVDRGMDLCPEAGYVGWNVAITQHGPVLIEGNSTPGTYKVQTRWHGTELGLRHKVREALEHRRLANN